MEQTVRRGRRRRVGQTVRDGHALSQRSESKFSELSVPVAQHSGCPLLSFRSPLGEFSMTFFCLVWSSPCPRWNGYHSKSGPRLRHQPPKR
uniref:Uncharacterized protein n=1 Tax=Trichogramma kaykai TaxID=54128 RepID=A0ABD2W902_9HYME